MPMAVKPARRAAHGVARARRQSHPHRGGQADAQRHHEGEGGNGDGDLVRRQGGDAERAHRQSGAVEQRHFEHHGDADRQAQTEQFGQRCANAGCAQTVQDVIVASAPGGQSAIASITTKLKKLEQALARPAPTRPSRGRPKWPKIRV